MGSLFFRIIAAVYVWYRKVYGKEQEQTLEHGCFYLSVVDDDDGRRRRLLFFTDVSQIEVVVDKTLLAKPSVLLFNKTETTAKRFFSFLFVSCATKTGGGIRSIREERGEGILQQPNFNGC